MPLSKEENRQYSRHLILDEIGHAGQEKLKFAKVLVIGAGGLGCPALQYLVAAGVGRIGIVDYDTIEQSNLQRQILFSHDDIGMFKSEVAAKKLSKLNPFVQIKSYIQKVEVNTALKLFNQYDIIVDGSDNFPTRYLANDASVLTNKPVVSGSIFKFEGQVSVFNYQKGPTYRCLYPNPPKPNSIPNCSEIGVLGVLPGIIGSFQANEVIKMICEIGNVLSGKLLTFNALTMEQCVFNLKKNENIKIKELQISYDSFCGVSKSDGEITWEELNESTENYQLLDVRTNKERKNHHIGGVHIPLQELETRFSEIPKDEKIVVYCASGVRSKTAINILKEKGITNPLLHLKNGLLLAKG